MLSRDEVKHIAKLARIKLSEKEIEDYRESLATLMNEVMQVTSVKVDASELISPSDNTNVWFTKSNPIENTEALLSNAPHRQGNFIEVERVLND